MKKSVLLFLCVSISVLIFGQNYKPPAGSFAPEFEFRPFGSNPIGLTFFKGRLFLSDKFALRTGINILVSNSKTKPVNYLGDVNEDIRSTWTIGIMPGFEKHFGNFERLSPYYGLVLGLAMKSSSEKYTYHSSSGTTVTETTGAWSDGSERGYYALGLNFVLGSDLYIVRNVYFGFECGIGFDYFSNVKVTETNTGVADQTLYDASSSFRFGINYMPFIRLGAWF